MKAATRGRTRSLPQRRRPSLAARVRPFWIFAVVAIALLAWGGTWLARSPWFRLTRVAVEVPLGSPVTRDQVRAAAAVAPGVNVWLLNPGAIAHRIEAIPYVARADVRRGQFPKPFLQLGISVRRPNACIAASSGRAVTIDAASRVLQYGCAEAYLPHLDAGAARLPAPGASIANPDVARLLRDNVVLGDAGVLLRSVRRDRWGGLEAVARDGVVLRFGDDADLAKKALLVQPVRAGIGTRREVRAIDLRAPGTPIVEFR